MSVRNTNVQPYFFWRASAIQFPTVNSIFWERQGEKNPKSSMLNTFELNFSTERVQENKTLKKKKKNGHYMRQKV